MSPLTQGSATIREFFVEGELPANWRQAFEVPLSRYAFRPIDIDKGDTRTAGWVNPRQVLDTDVSLDKLKVGPWVVLALRQDRLALNARLFRARVDLAMKEAATKAKKTQLTKNERHAVEEEVKLSMLRQQSPSTQIIEAAWHPDDGICLVAAASESITLIFSDLFVATFGLTLVPGVAGMRAIRWAERKGQSDRLEETMPIAFGAPASVVPVEFEREAEE
jgi:hypothetical protein